MKNRADKQRAYLLHRRPFSETSIIGYFFTREQGIIHILIRGASRKRGSYSLLQPTKELLISWYGKSELKTMRAIDLSCRHNIYNGNQLTILIYIDELLLKLLKPFDSHPNLYDYYHNYLLEESIKHNQTNIRLFEQHLFTEIGYGLSYDKDYISKDAIVGNANYIYNPGRGFTLANSGKVVNSFSGDILLQMKQNNFAAPQVAQAAKRLARIIIHHLMEDRQLSSRKLLQVKAVK